MTDLDKTILSTEKFQLGKTMNWALRFNSKFFYFFPYFAYQDFWKGSLMLYECHNHITGCICL